MGNASMRFARDIWNRYQHSGDFQDLIETLGYGAVAAGGQALFTDMHPLEIAASTGVGMVGAFPARKLGAQVGFAIGRPLDKRFPNVSKSKMAQGMVPTSPEGIEFYQDLIAASNKMGGMSTEVAKESVKQGIALDLLRSKQRQNFIDPAGNPRGFLEGALGQYGRARSDNVVQAGVAFASPFLINALDPGFSDAQRAVEIEALKEQLAKLEAI